MRCDFSTQRHGAHGEFYFVSNSILLFARQVKMLFETGAVLYDLCGSVLKTG